MNIYWQIALVSGVTFEDPEDGSTRLQASCPRAVLLNSHWHEDLTFIRVHVCFGCWLYLKETWIFLCNKINYMHQFQIFILSWSCTCFGQFICPSSGVYSLYTPQWYMSYRWKNWLSETCRASWKNKFVKIVHLVGFITKKFVTMHGHMNVKNMDIVLRTVCLADRLYPVPWCEPTAGPQATTFVAHRQLYHKSVL